MVTGNFPVSKDIYMAERISSILTAAKGLWLFDRNLTETQTDYSGNSNTAVPQSMLDTDLQYLNGQPIVNFGIPNTTKHYLIGNASSFTFGNGSTDSAFSVFALINFTHTEAYGEILIKYRSNGHEWRWFEYINNKIYFGFRDYINLKGQLRGTTSALTAGYHFVCATYDGRGGDTAQAGIKFYDNGNEVAGTKDTEEAGYVAMSSTAALPRLGAKAGGMGISGITQEELTPTQILNMWNIVKQCYGL